MKEIPFNEFLPKYQAGEIKVVDVREQEEYDDHHLDGVTLLPLSVLAEWYSELDKNQPNYVICRSGKRSARACLFLEEKGYDVTNVQGGMNALED